jgi:glycerol-3-phosphate acyltransferase PlsY
VLAVHALLPGAESRAAAGAILGHCFPVWLRFNGGKGVATLMGVATGLAWPIGLAYAVTWIGLLALTRISSLAGMSAAVVAPIAALLTGHADSAPVLALLALLVLWLHRANIARLRAGTEPRVGKKP